MSKIDDKYYAGLFSCEDTPILNKVKSVRYYIEMALLRTQAMFKYTGLPDTISKNILEFGLQTRGYSVVTEVNDDEITVNKDKYKGGIYCFSLGVGLGGIPDYNNRPTEAIINNPALGYNSVKHIGEDCVLIRNDPLLFGLLPIYERYAWALAENDITLRLVDINSRIPFIASVGNDNEAEGAKSFFTDILNGKPSIVTGNSFTDGLKTSPYSDRSNSIKDLIEYHQYLRAGMLNDIGLNANFNMKREALNTTESELNDDILKPLKDIMLDCRKSDFDKANQKFGTNITVSFNSAWKDITPDNPEQEE